MYCTSCGQKLAKIDKFCSKCGNQTANQKAIAENRDKNAGQDEMADISIDEVVVAASPNSLIVVDGGIKHVMTPFKFFVLSIVTLGCYIPYYGWKCWQIVKIANNDNISPTWRGLWIMVTSFSLFPKVFALAKESGHTSRVPAWLLATVLFLSLLCMRVIDRAENFELVPYIIMTFVLISIIALVMTPVIHAINHILGQPSSSSLEYSFGPNYFIIILYALIGLTYFGVGLASGTSEYQSEVDFKNALVDSCQNEGGSDSYCQCVYQEVRNRYSIEEVIQIGSKDRQLPDLDDIIDVCSPR